MNPQPEVNFLNLKPPQAGTLLGVSRSTRSYLRYVEINPSLAATHHVVENTGINWASRLKIPSAIVILLYLSAKRTKAKPV
jgi:hypothetical protein